ncbi:MAG: NADH-quinone oxidoreductase subunit B, partial [Rhodospirillales bacterium]
MGIMSSTAAGDKPQANPLAPGPEQDAVLKRVTGELQDKGFIVSNIDKLVTWARTGSL